MSKIFVFIGSTLAILFSSFLASCGPRTTVYTETLINPDGSRTVMEKKIENTGGTVFDGAVVQRYSAPNYSYHGRYVEWGTGDCGVSYHTVGLKEPHKHVWGNNNKCN